jgi:hypothetical protein
MTWRKLLMVFASGMLFVLGFVQSVRVTVDWWRGGLEAGPWEWLWIGLLPVWVFIYFRYYSIFRPGCRACLPPEDHSSARHDQPRGTE